MEIESTEPPYILVESDAVSSIDQDKVLGLMSIALIMPEVTTLKSKQDQDNISTSVVSESGPEPDVSVMVQEDTQEVKQDSDMPDRVLHIKHGDPRIQSRPAATTHTSEEELTLANTPRMIREVHGG